MADLTRQQARSWGWPADPATRLIMSVGAACSLLLGLAAFGAWVFGNGGLADDSYLWWTLAGFLLPIVASAGIALLSRSRPETAPAVGAAALMLAAAFLAALLG